MLIGGRGAMHQTRQSASAPSVRALLAITAVAVGGCALLATVLAQLDVHASSVAEHVTQVLGVVGAALFLGAGVLRVARWRVAGDVRSLLMGAALVVLGGLVIPLTSLAGVLMGSDEQSLLRAATAVTTTCVVLALVMRALTTHDDDQPHAGRLLAWSALACLVLFAGVVALDAWAPQALHAETLAPRVVRGTLLAVAWLYVGLEAALRSEDRPWAGRVAPLLGCMGVAELLQVASVYHDGGWVLASAGLVAALAAVTAHRSLVDLDEAATTGQARLEAVSSALHETRVGMSQHHAWREEMVHDARNALAGVRAALTTLERYDGVLDGPTSERLRTAALGEISHLEHLIIRSERTESVDFDVAGVVTNVVEAQRANGVEVTLHAAPFRAHGRPGDLATSLQNLLVNARDHGGNQVSVHTVTVAGRVEVHVSDQGPGLSESQLTTLFQRGARGPASHGSGLGLHVSRTLMRQQGGDLQLRRHHGGAVFVLVLNAAAPLAAPSARPAPTARGAGSHLTARPQIVAGPELT